MRSIQQQRTFNSSQAQTLYYTDLRPAPVYSIKAIALPMSLTSGHSGLRWPNRLGLAAELGMGRSATIRILQRSYRAMVRAAF